MKQENNGILAVLPLRADMTVGCLAGKCSHLKRLLPQCGIDWGQPCANPIDYHLLISI